MPQGHEKMAHFMREQQPHHDAHVNKSLPPIHLAWWSTAHASFTAASREPWGQLALCVAIEKLRCTRVGFQFAAPAQNVDRHVARKQNRRQGKTAALSGRSVVIDRGVGRHRCVRSGRHSYPGASAVRDTGRQECLPHCGDNADSHSIPQSVAYASMAAIVSRLTGRMMPRSQMMAAIRSAGVTSNAGL